jgi:hypothetical protein
MERYSLIEKKLVCAEGFALLSEWQEEDVNAKLRPDFVECFSNTFHGWHTEELWIILGWAKRIFLKIKLFMLLLLLFNKFLVEDITDTLFVFIFARQVSLSGLCHIILSLPQVLSKPLNL